MASRALTTHNGSSQKSAGAPNQTYVAIRTRPKNSSNSYLPSLRLYCTNLPDKLRKEDLRFSLYTLFSTYGPVLDVVALKSSKHRGQAHVVFRDIQASTQALRALQGFDFFAKEMVRFFPYNVRHFK